MSAAVENLLARLKGVRRCGSGWTAHCPAHEDRVPSLSVAEGDGGRVLVRCFAGCPFEAIVAAAGLAPADLSESDERAPVSPPRARRERRPTLATGEAEIARARDRLLADEATLERLLTVRGWTREAIERLELGLDDAGRVTFPYRDADGRLVGVGRYQPNPETRGDGPKLKADSDSRRELFPAPEPGSTAAGRRLCPMPDRK